MLWRLRVVWATGLVALLSATWPLWTPARAVPRLPAIEALCGVPVSADYGLLVLVGYGVARGAVGRFRGACLGICAMALAGLMALDQLRWQAWAYHLLLLGPVVAARPSRAALGMARLLAAGVYLYSALWKLDATFTQTLGRQVAGVIGLDHSTGLSDLVAATLPWAELLVAALLLAPRAQRLGVGLSVTQHLLTVVALGPLGLGHHAGVLVWNIVFACHVVVLFWRPLPAVAPSGGWLARGLIGGALLAPVGYPLGWWDAWPSWALYAPGGPRADAYLHPAVWSRWPDAIPLALEPHSEERGSGVPWRRIDLEAWVLDATWAPLYPSPRVGTALAGALNARLGAGDHLRVVVSGRAHPATGARPTRTLAGPAALRDGLSGYTLGTQAVWTRPP